MSARVLAWSSIAVQPVFLAAWLVAGALEPGFSGARSTVSALAADGASHPWIVMAGLAALGLGVLALAAALWMELRARVAVALFALVGTGLLVAAVVRLPCDPAVDHCAGGAHGVAATLAQLALFATPVALAPWSGYALLAGVIGLGFALLLSSAPAGTAERAVLSLGQVWFVLVGAGVLRAERDRSGGVQRSTGHRGEADAAPGRRGRAPMRPAARR